MVPLTMPLKMNNLGAVIISVRLFQRNVVSLSTDLNGAMTRINGTRFMKEVAHFIFMLVQSWCASGVFSVRTLSAS